MTTILAPATADKVSTADQIIETLATYVDEHNLDNGGGHQNTMLLAALITRLFDVTPREAIDLAKNDAFDPRVKVAGQARNHILTRAQGARLAAEQWTPTDGDTVTWNGIDGIWIVRGYEDDDTVWIHRPDVRMVPTIGRNGGGMVDLAGWRDEPAHEELVAIADLRPFEVAAGVTV
ncbi:hypothetical protein E1286_24095 [Nonomuraea terrae]|uniref:Uncharacterized protein n=1 Tax=Nonomuraea terrae TaxID=2530383 RepID=A0A4R4YPE7_9ACTN|nr:hypothetical protein [Nonomuraea terrae]TDD45402.1 hypothetical protein E1286_24095 [Nonomuraea terrae]